MAFVQQMKKRLLFVLRLHSHAKEHERIHVRQFIDGLGDVARAVAGAGFDPDEHRVFPFVFFLEGGDELEGMGRDNAVVMVGRGDERRRIGNPIFEVMQVLSPLSRSTAIATASRGLLPECK